MVWTTPVARSVIVISAFAMTAPGGSLTVPRMVPPATCARVGIKLQKTIAINPTNAMKTLRDTLVELMLPLLTQDQIPGIREVQPLRSEHCALPARSTEEQHSKDCHFFT